MRTNHIYAVYGASGFGREVMPVLRAAKSENITDIENFVFVDDKPESDSINGHRVMTYDDFKQADQVTKSITVAIANSKVREMLSNKCNLDSIGFVDVVASNVVRLDQVDIGDGCILSPFVTLTSNIKIGCHFHANIYSYVAHDCIIGDFVTFAPGVKCNGNVIVEDHVYIGTGAILKQGTPSRPLVIGRGAVIGAGAFVTKNVPAGVTVIGNPAKELTKESLRSGK